MTDAKFKAGDRVQDVRDANRVGTVKGAKFVAGTWRYKVSFGGGAEYVSEQFLRGFQDGGGPLDLLRHGSFGPAEDFRTLLALLKLKHRPTNNLFSFQASRSQFHPYQFRPLLRYLDNPSRRLLIADEVGLGKTIEAAFILQEEEARRSLRRVLVVCPASLREKWQIELATRFGFEFDLLDRDAIDRFLNKYKEMGGSARLRGITSLQTLRSEELLERIQDPELDLQLDLVVMDEIHHCRNMGTISRRVAGALSEVAEGLIGLSATPVHLKSENLFRLLEAMDAESFPDLMTFEERVAANKSIVETERLLRAHPRPSNADLLSTLRQVEATPFGEATRRYPAYGDLISRLSDPSPLEREEVVALQRGLSEINLLSRIVSRTRKRDAHVRRPVRSAATWPSSFSADEEWLYREVSDLCRRTYAYSPAAGFASVAIERQVASSLPAFVERHLGVPGTRGPEEGEDPGALDDDLKADEPGIPFWRGGGIVDDPGFHDLLRKGRQRLGDRDSKFERFVGRLKKHLSSVPTRKVIVFSYFRATLRYLERRLREEGIRAFVLHGGIPSNPRNPQEDQRGQVIREFRESQEVRVLLSSEVGAEGLDFQFCDSIVNYDLPWNPMVVEQRIGRIDRIGQASKKIHVLNLATKGTIEDEILRRLYDRIQIFKDTIGDLDEILGDTVQVLTKQLMDPELTEGERGKAIEEAAVAVLMRQKELEALEAQTGHLVSQDAYLDEELERVQRLRRFVTPAEVEALIRRFLEENLPAATLRKDPSSPGVWRLPLAKGLHELLLKNTPGLQDPMADLERWSVAMGGGRQCPVTFDPEVANGRRDVVLLNRFHPLTRAAVGALDVRQPALTTCTALAVRVATVPGPAYAFAVYLVTESKGQVCELVPVFVGPDGRRPLGPEVSDSLLSDMVEKGEPLGRLPDDDAAGRGAVAQELESAWEDRFESVTDRIEKAHSMKIARRLESLETEYRAFRKRHESAMGKLAQNPKGARIMEMRTRQFQKRTEEYEGKRSLVEDERVLDLRARCCASGIVEVRPVRGE